MPLLAFDLRRLAAYLVLPVLAAAVSLVGIGEVSIIFPMIGAALFSRERIVRDRFLALLAYAVPLAVVPALCGIATADGDADTALAGLGVGTYLAGIGYACYANFSTRDGVSLLRGMFGQFVYLACGAVVTVVINALWPADCGWSGISAAACTTMGVAALVCTYFISMSKFSALDL